MSKNTQRPTRSRLDVPETSHNQTPLALSEVQQTRSGEALDAMCIQLGTGDYQAGEAQVYWEETILL